MQIICWGTVALDAVLLLMPSLTRTGFGLLIFGDARAMGLWPDPARWCATVLHAVLSAVMLGRAAGSPAS